MQDVERKSLPESLVTRISQTLLKADDKLWPYDSLAHLFYIIRLLFEIDCINWTL